MKQLKNSYRDASASRYSLIIHSIIGELTWKKKGMYEDASGYQMILLATEALLTRSFNHFFQKVP